MGLQRVTITAWPSSPVAPQESEGVHGWMTSPGERKGKKVRLYMCTVHFLYPVATHPHPH